MSGPRLQIVTADVEAGRMDRSRSEVVTATRFSEAVRSIVALARRGGLSTPVFRSPPRGTEVDRTIRWRGDRPPVVAIARAGRPLAAVQADVIEGLVVANGLDERRAARFRRAAWAALEPMVDLREPRRSSDLPTGGRTAGAEGHSDPSSSRAAS